MTSRVWLYLTGAIIAVALITRGVMTVSSVNHQTRTLEDQGFLEQRQLMSNYVNEQTDEHKLIRLAKQIKNGDPLMLMIVADRAYEINPQNRDTVVLASLFHPELKPKILEIDPLYSDDAQSSE